MLVVSFFIFDTKDLMKNPQTKLGHRLTKLFNRKDSAFTLVSSGNEYDTFQCEVSDGKIINLICHDYPKLAYGILIDTKPAYPMSRTVTSESLMRAINQANLKSTSVITAMEMYDDKTVTLHFKTFVHLTKRMAIACLLDEALELHLQEIDVAISPHFKDIDKESVL